MSTLANWFRLLVGRQVLRKARMNCFRSDVRTFVDIPDVGSKLGTGPENEERFRVRRARPSDVPRVLRFVREHAQFAWPGLTAPPSSPQLLLCDYVARALAQGHSMVAEQQEIRRGWGQIRGLAVSVAVCPWDAAMLEKWARCVRCAHSRRLMAFTAHCLRAPALHEKYRVHNILQVILIVPNSEKTLEIVNVLAKNSIKRGKEVGFPLLRFDVTSDITAKMLEDLKLKKEWQLSYDILPEAAEKATDKDTEPSSSKTIMRTKSGSSQKVPSTYKHKISVFTAHTNLDTKS